MARSMGSFGIVVFLVVLGLVACQKKPLSKKQQVPVKQPPLLPPVPSRQQTELLTRHQLAFIRHHQNKQQLDKVNYSPYLCLPKYLCIVNDFDGEKRTTIVNGLHPVLKDQSFKSSSGSNSNSEFYQIPVNVPKLSIKNSPASGTNYKDRTIDDEFLRDQENNERAAMEHQQRQAFLNHQKRKESAEREESAEADSGESNEEAEDASQEDEGPGPNNVRNSRPSSGPPSAESAEYPLKDVDDLGDHLATVPWDDRPKNKSDVSLRDRLKSVLPSLPKIPFIGQGSTNDGPTTTQRSILRRMLGGRRNFFSRSKRDVKEGRNRGLPFMTKPGAGIQSTDQCRILYNGCDLNYDQIMEIAANDDVLIEGGHTTTTTELPPPDLGIKAEDDEADQAIRDFPNRRRPYGNKKPIQEQKKKPGFGFKVKNSKYGNSQSPYNQIRPKPMAGSAENDESDPMSIPSLPILPMRFTWGRPNFYKGRPPYPNIFDDLDSRRPTQPPTPPPPATPPPPVFVSNPVYKKVNRTGSVTNIVPINGTHALQIIVPSSKPFRPMKTSIHDKEGRPSSFASVFTEIAGSSGGLHDFFDKIANTVGHQPKRRAQKQISAPAATKGSSKLPAYRLKSKNKKKKETEQEEDESKSEEEEEDKPAEDETSAQNDEEEEEEEEVAEGVVTKNDDQDQEDEVADDEGNKNEESNEEEDEDKKDDDIDLPEGVPDHIKEAILEDIRTGGKKNKDGPDEPQQGQVQSPQEQGRPHGQGRPPGQGSPPGQGRPSGQGPPPGQGRPPGHGYHQQRPGPPPPHRQHQSYRRPGPPPGPNRPPPRRGLFGMAI